MCQKSDGGYYRALKTGDIQEILSRINAAISKPKPEPVMEIVKAAEKEKAFPMEILLIVAIGGIVAISMIAAKTLVFRSIASREESILVKDDNIAALEANLISYSIPSVVQECPILTIHISKVEAMVPVFYLSL